MTNPIYTYPHNSHDASITGGFVYRGDAVPGAATEGNYFFADYAQNWIKRPRASTRRATSSPIAQLRAAGRHLDGPYGDTVDLAQGPDGSLYYVDIGPFDDDNERRDPPRSQRQRQPAAGRRGGGRHDAAAPAPLTVSFSSAGSSDPEGRR